jgi:DNA gyrase subunit A
MIASNGVIIRMKVNTISIQGRSATGVKLMSVENDSKVTAIAPVIQQEETPGSEN